MIFSGDFSDLEVGWADRIFASLFMLFIAR